jgi:predicted HTH domain antitoxin
MVEVTIQLPENIARAFGETDETRSQRLLEDAALEEYRSGRLSHRQVGAMLGMDYWQTEDFLSARGVPLNYSVSDLESDRQALEKYLASK